MRMGWIESIIFFINFTFCLFGILVGEKFNRTKKYNGEQKLIIYFGIFLIILSIIIITYLIEYVVSKIICYIFLNLLIFWLAVGGITLSLIIRRKKRKSKENLAEDYIMLDSFNKELFKDKNRK